MTDSDFLTIGSKSIAQKKQKPEVVMQHCQKKRSTLSMASAVSQVRAASVECHKNDELLDMLSMVIDDIGDFNVDELLVAGSDKFNLSEET
ncbi:hypothetical protein RUM43_011397 [Polyplax serrata]|uniref:Uncharacterized protein n=1 Tax=Polyplax serrata TaxID=468196 RepID=A0AAN8S7V1_POLSC